MPLKELLFGRNRGRSLALTDKELLCRFRNPGTVSNLGNSEWWTKLIGETPSRAIKRLINSGLLEEADVAGALEFKFKVPDLKKMLKHRGLPVSGRKSVLIERLLTADAGGMATLVKGIKVLRCSERGTEVTSEFLEEKEKEREVAWSESHEAPLCANKSETRFDGV